jgi:hypothetical protein
MDQDRPRLTAGGCRGSASPVLEVERYRPTA